MKQTATTTVYLNKIYKRKLGTHLKTIKKLKQLIEMYELNKKFNKIKL